MEVLLRFLVRARLLRCRALHAVRYYAGADFQDRLMRGVKWLPSVVAGFLVFTYIYAGSSQRYRRTYLAAAVWYTTLSWSSYNRVSRWWQRRRARWAPYTWLWAERGSPPVASVIISIGHRRRPSSITPTFRWGSLTGVALLDQEVWSGEAGFPVVADEPFQDLADEYFEDQQDDASEGDEEWWGEEDDLYGTNESTMVDEEVPVRFYGRYPYHPKREWLTKKEYYLLEEQVDAWNPQQVPFLGLTALASSGDGPQVNDYEDIDLEPERPGSLADWHRSVCSYKRISQGPLETGPNTYLLTEHRGVWSGDPHGRPTRWYAKARGVLRWLFRTPTGGWRPRRWHLRTEMDERSRRIYSRGYRNQRHANGRRRGNLDLRVHRRRRRYPHHRPGPWLNPLVPADVEIFDPNSRYQIFDLSQWTQYLQNRFRRLPGVAFIRRRYPRRRVNWRLTVRYLGNFKWRWYKRRPLLWRRDWRKKGLAWHAPRYEPLYQARQVIGWSLPGRYGPTYPATGVAGLLVVAAVLTAEVVTVTWGTPVVDWLMSPTFPQLPAHDSFLIRKTHSGLLRSNVPGWSPDFFARVTSGAPEWWETARLQPPRGERTTPSYRPWDYHVGQNWRHNPGIDLNLFTHTAIKWWSLAWENTFKLIPPQEIAESLTHKASYDRRGIVLFDRGFQFYLGKWLPSYAHWDDRVDDMWVHRKVWRWMNGFLEPFTIRREIDLHYNTYYPMPGDVWQSYINMWVESNQLNYVIHAHNRAAYEGLRHGLNLPVWVPPRQAEFAQGYLTYWSDLSRVVTWPSDRFLSVWTAPQQVGRSDYFSALQVKPTRTAGWWWTHLPTQWEPHLNGYLLKQWATPPATVIPSWWGWPAEWINTAVYTGATTWRWLGYTGGVALWCGLISRPGYWSTRGAAVTATIPITRVVPQWTAHPIGQSKHRGLSPRSRALTRFTLWRRLRRSRSTLHPARLPRSIRSQGWIFLPSYSSYRVVPTQPARVAVATAAMIRQKTSVTVSPRVGSWYTPLTIFSSSGWLTRPVTTTVAAYLKNLPTRPRKYHRTKWWYTRRGRRYGPRGRIAVRRRPRQKNLRGWNHRENPTAGLSTAGVTAGVTEVVPPVGGFSRQRQWHAHRYGCTLNAWQTFASVVNPGTAAAITQLSGVNYPGRMAWYHAGAATAATTAATASLDWLDEDDSQKFVNAAENDDDELDEAMEDEIDLDCFELTSLSVFTPQLVTVTLTGQVDDYLQRQTLTAWQRHNGLPSQMYAPIGVADWEGSDPWPAVWTQWPTHGVDHPGYLLGQLTGYTTPRWGRLVTHGVDTSEETAFPAGRQHPTGTTVVSPTVTATVYQRYAPAGGDLLYHNGVDALFEELFLTGWADFDTGVDPHGFFEDDLEGVELGGVGHGWGYRVVGPAGYLSHRYRTTPVDAVWSSCYGINGWRYLAGETTTSTVIDHERLWLEALTQTYVEPYDVAELFDEDEVVIRDEEDLLPGFEVEDSDEEIPRLAPTDYPISLLSFAVAGASAGETEFAATMGRLADVGGRAEAPVLAAPPIWRRELRRYYKQYRQIRSKARRRLRRGTLRRKLSFAVAGVLSAPVAMVTTELQFPDGNAAPLLVRPDLTYGVAPAHGVQLVGDYLLDEEVLRLWALTEIYLGDYPSGRALGC